MQIFLLHFAGGNCYSYNFLNEFFNDEYEIYSLELPGRGKRFGESLILNKQEAVNDYVNQIREKRNNNSYILYGHSMGATLGLNVVNRMEILGDPPVHLIVSGNSGPSANKLDEKRYLMNGEGFKKELIKLGGISKEILENEELYNFFSPIIRADFEILEKDDFSEEGLLIETPIYTLMGDREESSSEIENWKNYTSSSSFQTKILKGNHFFIYNHSKEITEIIKSCAENYIPI